METQIDSNEDAEYSISIQGTSLHAEELIPIQDVEDSDPTHAVDNELANEDADADGGDYDNMNSGDNVVAVENMSDKIQPLGVMIVNNDDEGGGHTSRSGRTRKPFDCTNNFP